MGDERLTIDHVVLGVQDLGVAARRLESECGLFAWESGANPDLGTRGMVVSIRSEPTQYLEIIAVDDVSRPYASFLSTVLTDGDRPIGWAVGTDDLASVGAREHIEPQRWDYTWPDGLKSTFHTIMAADWTLPFFIQYHPPTEQEIKVWERRSILSEQQQEKLGVKPISIAWVEVGGEEVRTREWLGGVDLPIRYAEGPPGILAAGIATSAGEIVIR